MLDADDALEVQHVPRRGRVPHPGHGNVVGVRLAGHRGEAVDPSGEPDLEQLDDLGRRDPVRGVRGDAVGVDGEGLGEVDGVAEVDERALGPGDGGGGRCGGEREAGAPGHVGELKIENM